MVEETLFLAARNSCGQQLCAVQGHHKTRQTKPSGLPVFNCRKFSLKVPRLSSTSPVYWMSTQTPPSRWFGSPEAEPTASSSGQTRPVSWLCGVQQSFYAEFFCKTCSDTPSLCPHPCFEWYHTLSHFRS